MYTFQKCTQGRIELILPDEHLPQVNQVAEKLGIRPVGWIFTDLIADDLTKGTVKHFRGNIVSIAFFVVILHHKIVKL